MRLTISLGLSLLLVACAAGCSKLGQAWLHEPQPAPKQTDVPPQMTLEMITAMGGTAPVRFEDPSYTGIQQNSFTEIGTDMDPSVCPDGQYIVFSSTRHARTADIYMKTIDGQTVTKLSSGSGNKIQPVFSPDGQYIAFASDRRGNWDIYVMTADGRRPFQLTDGLSHDVHPSWSPDGSRICYSTYNNRTGQWEIWISDVANPARRKFIAHGLFPVWSPDPTVNRIAFQMARQRGTRLFSVWTIDLVDDEARMLTEIAPASEDTAAISPGWSPDGTHLTYATCGIRMAPQQNQQGQQPGAPVDEPTATAAATGTQPVLAVAESDIWVTTLDGRTRINLTGDRSSNWSPCWASDGRIYFTSNRGGAENIWSLKPLDTALMQATRVGPHRLSSSRLPGGAAVTPAATRPSAAAAAAARSEGSGAQPGQIRSNRLDM